LGGLRPSHTFLKRRFELPYVSGKKYPYTAKGKAAAKKAMKKQAAKKKARK
tara:strand:- start:4380 stop:4532 length:153 start_codon:yes stop_codon:yes gene_type:complete